MNDFLFRHVEKFIFAVLVLLAVFLVYRGFQMPDYLAVQQPERMQKGAEDVRKEIDDDHWQEIAPPRLETIDVVARTNESIRPVNPQVYRLIPWEAKSLDMSIKREDPVIAAPIDLRVTPVLANIAYKSANPEYPLTELENAEPVERAPEQPDTRRRRGRNQLQGDPYGMSMGMGMGSEGMTEPGYGMPGYGMESSAMAGPSSMLGGPGATTASRRIDPKLYDQGFRPQGSTENLVPAMGQFIAGVALMPHKKLHQAFEEALQQAEGYNPRRDQPVYLLFEVYRADVTNKAVDELTDQDWTLVANSEFYKRLVIRLWAGMAKEIVTGKYRDPALTTPIPPILLDHYGRFASHPEIPVGDEDPRAALQQMAQQQILPSGPIAFDAEEDPFANRGRVDPLRSLPPGVAGSGLMGAGAGMYGAGGGYGMSGMGQYGAVTVADQPDYKLIRFYDFYNPGSKTSPQPGRRYVYRIRTAIEDPNFPEDPTAQPRNSTLSAEVYRRVAQATARAAETKRRESRRWSEFSTPSPIVSLPSLTSVYAGPVTPASTRKMQVDGREIDYVQKPASGKLVAAHWDRTYQVPVPIFTEVLRGSVIAKQGDFDVPDPLTFIVKKLPEANYNTQTVVVDIAGGNPLEISPAENQTAPGVMLLFDAQGGLRVSDEVETQRDYRLYSFAEDRGE